MKMDPSFVSKQKHEIFYIARKFKVKTSVVKRIIMLVGRSRRKVYDAIRLWIVDHPG